MNKKLKIVVNYLKGGGIGVLPTDTIYGLVTSALDKKAVERVYKIRKRNSKKPLIILISSLKDLSLFGVKLTDKEKEILENIWPGKVSVILHCNKNKFSYLHRGTRSLAFRLPKKKLLIDLIKKAGPLVAPSANPEGSVSAKNIKEAKKYFSDEVDFYFGVGALKSKPSTLIKLKNNEIDILRRGAVKINL